MQLFRLAQLIYSDGLVIQSTGYIIFFVSNRHCSALDHYNIYVSIYIQIYICVCVCNNWKIITVCRYFSSYNYYTSIAVYCVIVLLLYNETRSYRMQSKISLGVLSFWNNKIYFETHRVSRSPYQPRYCNIDNIVHII